MIRIILGLIVIFFLLANTPTAKADNSEEVAIGILGGVIGGLVLGEVFDHNHHHKHKHKVKRERYIERCTVRWKRFYDPYYEDIVEVPIENCWVERVR